MDVTKVSTTTLVLDDDELTTVCMALALLRKQKIGQPHPTQGSRSPLTSNDLDRARVLHIQLIEDDFD